MSITLSLIAALGAKNRVIGKDNQLLWQIPEDMKRFKLLTIGHSVIMGRKTWESLPERFRPLPKRANIVVSRNRFYEAPGATVCSNLYDAISEAVSFEDDLEVFVIGGGELYREALNFADKLYLTLVHDEKEGDAFFPEYEHQFKNSVFEEAGEFEGVRYTFLDLVH